MTFDWTADRVETLRSLVRSGATASQISQRMGAPTRNTVIGKMYRLGLTTRSTQRVTAGRPRKAKPSTPAVPSAPPSAGRSARFAAFLQKRMQRDDPGLAVEIKVPPPTSSPIGEGVTLTALRAQHCRFPIGNPGEPGFRFCGACRADVYNSKRWYCSAHEAVAYQQRLVQ